MDGSSISVSIQATTPQGPAPSPQIGFIGAPLSSFGTSPLPLVQLAANAAAFEPGGRPDIEPEGAVAWATRNPAVGHADGPFALPGQPNPDALPVLDPLQLPTLGPVWSPPSANCPSIHARGDYFATPPHPDPDPTGCSHGPLVYLPLVTSSLTEPTPGAIVLGASNLTMTAVPTTSGLAVDGVEFYLADTLVGSALASPWSIVVTPASPSMTSGIEAFAIAFDTDGVTRSSGPVSVVHVAPLGLTLPEPLPAAVVGGQPVTGTIDVSGGLPPFVLDLEVDDQLVDTWSGSVHTFEWSYTPPETFAPEPVEIQFTATDAASQAAETPGVPLILAPRLEVEVTPPLRAVVAGNEMFLLADVVGLWVSLDAPPPGIEVLQGTGVTITAGTAGGVGGVPVVRSFANGEQVGVDTNPADGFGFVWTADPEVGDPPAPPTLQLVPVDLVAEADDALGQTGVSQPVGIQVARTPIPQIPALGGAALVALGILIAGVSAHTRLRRTG